MTTLLNQPATKKDIKEIKDCLKMFAIKDDLKAFATKEDLRAFATKEDLRRCAASKSDLEDFEERFDKKLTTFKSDILDAVDGVMGELKAIRENQEVHDFSHSRINGELSDHEERIRKLKKSPAVV